MNHLTKYVILSEFLISFLTSIWLIHESCKTAQHFMNLLQCIITCFAVFLTCLHEQIEEEKFCICLLFRKVTSLLWSVWICVIMKLSVFCNCAWSLTALWLKSLILSKFQLKNLSVHQYFYLYIKTWSAIIFIFSLNLSQNSAHCN